MRYLVWYSDWQVWCYLRVLRTSARGVNREIVVVAAIVRASTPHQRRQKTIVSEQNRVNYCMEDGLHLLDTYYIRSACLSMYAKAYKV